MGGLHALIALAWTVAAASSPRSVSSPSLENRSWRGPLRSSGLCAAGVTLCPPSLRAAATLVHEGEDEVPVAIELRSRRLALKQRHRVVEVLESVVPELFGRAVSRSTRGTSPAVPDSGDQ